MKNTVLRFLITAVLLAGLQQVRADIKHTPTYYDQNARKLFKKERWRYEALWWTQ